MRLTIRRISIATLVSFAARGLDQTDIFCYQAISSAGVVLVLPGYVIRKSISVHSRLYLSIILQSVVRSNWHLETSLLALSSLSMRSSTPSSL